LSKKEKGDAKLLHSYWLECLVVMSSAQD